MKVQNIYNNFNKIYLSIREDKKLVIKEDNTFFPYFFEPDPNGQYLGYDGTKLTKIHCKAPHEVKNQRTSKSYEADVLYPKRYLIDNINFIEKSNTKYILYDIEVKASEEFPNPQDAKYPVTFIVAWDNHSGEYKTWDYRKFTSEYEMLKDFAYYINIQQPDSLLAWNHLEFDWPYLSRRYPDFAKSISPIEMEQFKGEELPTPALISILDLLALDYKYTIGKRDSYALNNVCLEEFNDEESNADHDFNNEDLTLEKCQNDVARMVKLMSKYNYIEYFDEIRRETGCLWEDLMPKKVGYKWQSNNSKPIDMMFLREAKKLGVVLPSKQADLEHEEYDGAYRHIFEKGVFTQGVGKFDISSAYPMALADLCLDPSNFIDKLEENSIAIPIYSREKNELVSTYYFKQNDKAILPTVVKKLLTIKNLLKQELKKLNPETEEYKNLERRYATQKTLINSLYGVLGNRFFRLYKKEVAETDTAIVRHLLHFVKDKLTKQGKKIIYVDTDSIFVEGKEDITPLLNKYVTEWGLDNFGKKVNIKFEFEGYFEKLFLVALCRYRGFLNTGHGIKEENKGIQLLRRDANIHKKEFQKGLLDYIMEGNNKENICQWIENWITNIYKRPLLDFGNPCKFAKPREEYKKQEIFFRAYDNTKNCINTFQKKIGQKFYYIYVKGELEVIAFDEKINPFLYENFNLVIDYNKIIENDIFNVAVPVFQGLGWGKELLDLAEKFKICLGSQHRNNLLEEYQNYEELKTYYSAKEFNNRVNPKPIKEKKPKKIKANSIDK